MTTPKNGFADEIDDEPDDLSMPIPPKSSGGILSRFNIPQGVAQTVLVSFIITVVILAMMSFSGGVMFVTKKDFTDNMASVSNSLIQVQVDVNKAKADVTAAQEQLAEALNNLPSQISSQVSNSISQATSQWNTQISSLTSRLDDLNSNIQSYSTTLNQLSSSMSTNHQEVEALGGDIDGLMANVAALQTTLNGLSDRIADLEEEEDEPATIAPTITSFSPSSGTTGTSVIIIGTNFAGATSVAFDGTSAQSFTVNSGTQITAVVGSGSTGIIVVTTPNGSVASSSIFTFASGGATQGNVYTSYTPTTVFGLPNNVNIQITNNSGKDIFGGQFSMTIQYINAIPSSTNMVVLSSSEITWGATGSTYGVSLTVVGTADSVFIMNGQTKIITVSITPPPSGTQFRVTNVTYTGYPY